MRSSGIGLELSLDSRSAMGMATIKVHDPDRALAELAALLGVDLAPRGEPSAG